MSVIFCNLRRFKTVEPQYGDVLLKILLIAGKSPYLGNAYDLIYFLMFIAIKYLRENCNDLEKISRGYKYFYLINLSETTCR